MSSHDLSPPLPVASGLLPRYKHNQIAGNIYTRWGVQDAAAFRSFVFPYADTRGGKLKSQTESFLDRQTAETLLQTPSSEL